MNCSRASVFLLLLLVWLPSGGNAQTCGDGVWSPCEFCGRDAYLVTGHAEMNHDCVVDLIDLGLFAQDYGHMGVRSGDFNGDGLVNLMDFAIFCFCFVEHPQVTPCEPCDVAPVGCGGTVRLSLSTSSPYTSDVDTIDLEPGVEHPLRVVTENVQGMATYAGALITSSNVVVGSGAFAGQLNVGAHATAWTSPIASNDPLVVASYQFYVTDSEPAFIKPADTGLPNAPLGWTTVSPPQRYRFETVASVGVNGPPPLDETDCEGMGVPETESVGRLWGYPNPTGSAVFFSLPSAWTTGEPIDVQVFDPAGRSVRAFSASASTGVLSWDGTQLNGSPAPAGAYFVQFRRGERTLRTKVMLVR